VIRASAIDHLVLTVRDVDETCRFYHRVLGMEPITFGDGRRALRFGRQKFNLHAAGAEIAPHAARPVPGSADLCLVTDAASGDVVAHLEACGVAVEQGPVGREGATGALSSVYFRDPDGNLVEVGTPA
jgi:catechol 2,3-dioxygenase-like lactoylglutathione lyase family enzyme